MKLITAKQIADLLQLAPRYVAEKLTKRSDFPKPYRIGACRRWPESEVFSWLEKRRA